MVTADDSQYEEPEDFEPPFRPRKQLSGEELVELVRLLREDGRDDIASNIEKTTAKYLIDGHEAYVYDTELLPWPKRRKE